MAVAFCPHCDASLTDAATFCGNCGHETRKASRQHRQSLRRTHDRLRTTSKGVSWIFVGSLLTMMLWSWVPVSEHWSYLGVVLSFLVITFIAASSMGPNTVRHSFGRAPDGVGLGLAIAVPLVSLPISLLYVGLLAGDGAEPAELQRSGFLLALVLSAVLPALVEEWMCRGVLWVALRPLTTRNITIFTTAALFSTLHGLNGGFVLELPHRFVMGLLLGWLRASSASVWPCVLAHFLHNAAAAVIVWDWE